MLTAMNGDGVKVHARLADRAAAPFTCFCCRSQLTLRRGAAKAAHFAHRPPVSCEYGQGESDEHRRAKEEIFEHLSRSPGVEKLELERDLREVRPDVSCYIGGVPVAVEVQASCLSTERPARPLPRLLHAGARQDARVPQALAPGRAHRRSGGGPLDGLRALRHGRTG